MEIKSRTARVSAAIWVWGILGAVYILNIIEHAISGTHPEGKVFAGYLVAWSTAIGVLVSDITRRIAGLFWLIAALIGFLSWALEWDIEHKVHWLPDSPILFTIGLLSAGLIFNEEIQKVSQYLRSKIKSV